MATKYKKGDQVLVTTGKDKGKQGEITHVNVEKQRITIQGINIIKKHAKQTNESKGGIIELEAPIHWSNAQLIEPVSKKPTKVGFEKTKNGVKKRKSKVSGELF